MKIKKHYETKPQDLFLTEFLYGYVWSGSKSTAEDILNHKVSFSKKADYNIPSDPQWDENPYNDPTWEWEYQSLHFVNILLKEYYRTRNDNYLVKAKYFIDDWLEDNPSPSRKIDRMWRDHTVADRLAVFVFFWELIRTNKKNFKDGDEKLLKAIHVHGNWIADENNYTEMHNHGYFQDVSLLLASVTLSEMEDSGKWQELSLKRLAEQINWQVNAEGIHKEHSPSYHIGMLNRFQKTNTIVKNYQLSLPVSIDAVTKNMYDFLTYMSKPDGRFPLLGDSSSHFVGVDDRLAPKETVFSTTQGQKGVMPTHTDKVYPDAGYAFFRDQWKEKETFKDTVYLAFIASYFSATHKHCDDLSILLYAFGEDWLVDSGFYNYDRSDPMWEYSVSPSAHNVITVDKTSYHPSFYTRKRGEPTPRLIQEYQLGNTESFIVGEHDFYKGVKIKRKVIFEKPFKIIVYDDIISNERHRYDLNWHIAHDKIVRKINNGEFFISSPASKCRMRMTTASDGDNTSNIVTGQVTPDIQGWYFPKFQNKIASPVIRFSVEGSSVKFITTIEMIHD